MSQDQPPVPKLPAGNLVVDYGNPAGASSNPMDDGRRAAYHERIRGAADAQAAGAARAMNVFIK